MVKKAGSIACAASMARGSAQRPSHTRLPSAKARFEQSGVRQQYQRIGPQAPAAPVMAQACFRPFFVSDRFQEFRRDAIHSYLPPRARPLRGIT